MLRPDHVEFISILSVLTITLGFFMLVLLIIIHNGFDFTCKCDITCPEKEEPKGGVIYIY